MTSTRDALDAYTASDDVMLEDDVNERIVYFFGATSPLSNFHAALFRLDEQVFTTVEQAFLSRKAKLFLDDVAYDGICHEKNPFALRELSMKIRNFDKKKWADVTEANMYDAYMAKFRQNSYYCELLFGTQDATLAYCSPKDMHWGTGCPRGTPRSEWKGLNRLGEVLEQVRFDIAHERNVRLREAVDVPVDILRQVEGTDPSSSSSSSSSVTMKRREFSPSSSTARGRRPVATTTYTKTSSSPSKGRTFTKPPPTTAATTSTVTEIRMKRPRDKNTAVAAVAAVATAAVTEG